MRHLGLLLLCGTVGSLCGCVFDHELGDTEGDADSDDAGTTGGGPGGSDDGGSQSNTSTPPGTDSGSDDGETGDDGSSGSDDGTTGGSGVVCESDEDFMFMTPTDFVDPFPGLEASFAVVLGGTCTPSVEALDTIDTYIWHVDLSCTVSGRIDQDGEVVDAPLDFTLSYESTQPPEAYTGSLDTTMQLRIVADWWGMGWDRWVVLERSDGVIVLDSFDGQIIDPLDSRWADEVAQLLGGDLGKGEPPAPWHGDLAIDLAPAECVLEMPSCGGEARSFDVGWQTPSVTLEHGRGTNGGIGTTVEELSYGVFARSVIEHVPPICLDTPSFELAFSAWAIEP